jgi:hypothetical protein
MTPVDPAPILANNRCSDCGVAPLVIANGSMKVCPRCYGLLWRADQTEIAAQEARRAAMRLQQQTENVRKRRELVEARRIAKEASAKDR